MTIDIPDDLSRELARVAAAQGKTLVELVLERLRSVKDPADSPQAVLEALRRLPIRAWPRSMSLMPRLLPAGFPSNDRDPIERRPES